MSTRISAAEYRAMVAKPKRGNKYHAQRVFRCAACGLEGAKGAPCAGCAHPYQEVFDSRGECRRYDALRLLEKAGKIRNLTRQVRHDLFVKGLKIGTYVPDFEYEELQDGVWNLVSEDFKSPATMTPKAKRSIKHFEAQTGREVRITGG